MYQYIRIGFNIMQTVSATDLARHTREILDKVVSHGETVSVERNQILIAQIIPPRRVMTASQALDGLAIPLLSAAKAAAWLKESKGDFGDEVRDPWA
jgi:antitoxin (DNA-binding transcriptional repressor) of toxin-antitoxin stability system